MFAAPTLVLDLEQYRAVVAHCWNGFPDEACGLLAGPLGENWTTTGVVAAVYPCRNAAASARLYTVDERDAFAADKAARAQGLDIVGGWHSHTHTEAYPSDTDVRQAQYVGPNFLLAIVSLKRAEPALRAYRVVEGQILEVAVEVPGLA